MKLLVIGAGMMGSAAAYDMARQDDVSAVTLADADSKRAKETASRVNKLARTNKVTRGRHRRGEREKRCQADERP